MEVHKLINRLNLHSHRFRPVCSYFSLIAKLVFEVLSPNPPLLHLMNPERLFKNQITIKGPSITGPSELGGPGGPLPPKVSQNQEKAEV